MANKFRRRIKKPEWKKSEGERERACKRAKKERKKETDKVEAIEKEA